MFWSHFGSALAAAERAGQPSACGRPASEECGARGNSSPTRLPNPGDCLGGGRKPLTGSTVTPRQEPLVPRDPEEPRAARTPQGVVALLERSAIAAAWEHGILVVPAGGQAGR